MVAGTLWLGDTSLFWGGEKLQEEQEGNECQQLEHSPPYGEGSGIKDTHQGEP